MFRALLVPTLIALVVVDLTACAPKEVAPDPVRAVRTLTVGSGDSAATTSYAAEIKARTEARLGFRVAGKLLSRAVNAGDSVRAGQVLAELDGQDLRLGQEAAQAAVQAARSSLALAQADFRRYRELREQGFIGAAELERREATLKTAQSQFDQAQAQASVQRNQAGYAVLRADVAGIVTQVDAEPGQVLATGATVLRLAQDGPRDAVFSVPEDRVEALRALIGRPGALNLQGWASAAKQPATVREVAAAADPTTRTFLVKADIGVSPLRLGQTATVFWTAAPRSGLIRLPLAAVVQGQGQSMVWLLDPKSLKVRSRPVLVGGADGNSVLIAAGLQSGDEVVVAGTHVLTPDLQVKRYVEPGTARPAAAAAASQP